MLGDAGMVLRDPSTAHLLAHQVPAATHPRVKSPPYGVLNGTLRRAA